jgi:hypothetical protein
MTGIKTDNGVLVGLGAAAVLTVVGVAHQRSMRSGGSMSRSSSYLRSLRLRFVDADERDRYSRLQGTPAVIEVDHAGTVVRLVLPHYGYKNGVDAFSYGENLLVLVTDLEVPSYVLTLYTEDEVTHAYRVDQDIAVSGLAEVEDAIGKRFEIYRPITIANKLLTRMS